jgi:hypothetical protein
MRKAEEKKFNVFFCEISLKAMCEGLLREMPSSKFFLFRTFDVDLHAQKDNDIFSREKYVKETMRIFRSSGSCGILFIKV